MVGGGQVMVGGGQVMVGGGGQVMVGGGGQVMVGGGQVMVGVFLWCTHMLQRCSCSGNIIGILCLCSDSRPSRRSGLRHRGPSTSIGESSWRSTT